MYTVTGTETFGAGSHTYLTGITIPMGATLNITGGANVETTRITVMGTLNIGSSSSIITDANPVNIKLDGNTAVEDTNEGAIMIMGGTFNAYGPNYVQKTPHTKLLGTLSPGGNTITVATANNWRAGDKIAIGSSTMYAWETEEFQILSITGTTITLDHTASYYHYGSVTPTIDITEGGVTKAIDARAVVVNLSRPIRIYTEETDIYGAHIMAMMGGKIRMEGVEMDRLGMSKPSTFPYKPNGDSPHQGTYSTFSAIPNPPTSPSKTQAAVRDTGAFYNWSSAASNWILDPTRTGRPDSPSGQAYPGKYSVHWHKTGDSAVDDYARNCVTYRSRHKSFVAHDVNGVELLWNVAYRGWSQQFSLGEDGKAKNLVCNDNVVMYMRRLYNGDDAPSNDTDFAFKSGSGVIKENRIAGGSWQNEMHPGAFIMWTSSVEMQRNIVSGVISGVGYYFDGYAGRGDGTMEELDPSVERGPFIFKDNSFHAILTEGGHKFGTTQDVTQGVNFSNIGVGFSYRSAGWGIWMDQFDPDRPASARGDFQYLFENTQGYNSNGFFWTESPAFRLKNSVGFHIATAGVCLGGFVEDFVCNRDDLMGTTYGIIADNRNPAAHPDFGNLTGELNHYEGYYAGIVQRNFDNIHNGGFNIWSTDKSDCCRIGKKMMSFKGCHLSGYTNFLRATQPAEGPIWFTDCSMSDTDTAVGDNTDFVYCYTKGNAIPTKGPVSYTNQSTNGIVRWDDDNKFNLAVVDIDNDVIYFADNTTGVASNYVFVRITSRNRTDLKIIQNKSDNAATWYDTNHSTHYGREGHEFYDEAVTGIFLKGSTQTFTPQSSAELQIDVWSLDPTATITLTNTTTASTDTYAYFPGAYRDGFNINYLTDTSGPPSSSTLTTLTSRRATWTLSSYLNNGTPSIRVLYT